MSLFIVNGARKDRILQGTHIKDPEYNMKSFCWKEGFRPIPISSICDSIWSFWKIYIFQQCSYCCLCVFTVALWYMRTTPTTNVICVRSSQFITIAETSGPPQRPHMPQNRPQWAETTLIGKFSRSWTRVGTLFDRIWWSEFCKILKHQIFALPYFLLEFCTLMKSIVCNFFLLLFCCYTKWL